MRRRSRFLIGLLSAVLAACAAGSASSTPSASPAPPSASPAPSAALVPSPAPSQSPAPSLSPAPSPQQTDGSVQPAASPGCPKGEVLEMHDYVAADPDCFAGRTVRIRAWEDEPMSTGWEEPAPKPSWLSFPDGTRFFWSADPVDPDACMEAACPGLFVHQDPSSPVRLGKAGRWVEITGHRHDPAAETCRYADGFGGDDPAASALLAQQLCRAAFVIESISATTAP